MKTVNIGKDVEKCETSTLGGNAKQCSHWAGHRDRQVPSPRAELRDHPQGCIREKGKLCPHACWLMNVPGSRIRHRRRAEQATCPPPRRHPHSGALRHEVTRSRFHLRKLPDSNPSGIAQRTGQHAEGRLPRGRARGTVLPFGVIKC